MTEATQVNAAVLRFLAPLGHFVRHEDAYQAGIPDWSYTIRGVSGWIEAKLIPPSGEPPRHLTEDQLAWGEAEARADGRWFLLGLREAPGRRFRSWLLYDVERARGWFEKRSNRPLVDVSGPFPYRDIGRYLIGIKES